MEQLILHLFGDYVTQSDWMASRKTTDSVAAAAHAIVYSLPFLFLGPSPLAFAVILSTHFLIDRFRLARYVCYAKNYLAPAWTMEYRWVSETDTYVREPKHWWYRWVDCETTGYHKSRPDWLAVWLLIAADNTLHLAINHLALRFL